MGTMVIEGVEIPIKGDTPTAEEAGRALNAMKRIKEQRLILAGEQVGLSGGPEAPIPEPGMPNLRIGERTSREEIFERTVRDPAITGGALAGGEAGAIAGGAAAGPPGALVGGLVGGGLGAAGGVAFSGFARNMMSQIFPEEFSAQTATDISEDAARELGLDVGFTAGGQAGLKIISGIPLPGMSRLGLKFTSEAGEALFGRIFGLRTEDARRLQELGEAGEIPLGAINVSASRFTKGFPQVVGTFPYVGAPFLKARNAQDAKLLEKMGETLEVFSPYELTAGQIGLTAVQAARLHSREFRTVESALWDSFRSLSEGAEAFVPTAKTQETVADILANSKGFAVKTKPKADPLAPITGEVIQEGEGRVILHDKIRDFLLKLSDATDFQTPKDFRSLMLEFKQVMDEAGKDGFTFKRAGDLKLALKSDLLDADFSKIKNSANAAEIRDAFFAANEFTAKGILNGVDNSTFAGGRSRFQGPAGAQLKAAVPNIFEESNFQLTQTTQEEAVNLLLSFRAPALIDDFERLVGKDVLKEAAGEFFRRSEASSFRQVQSGIEKREIFDPRKFGEQLGVFGKGLKNEAKQRLLKKVGVDTEQLAATLKTASRFINPRDPSTFVARRTVLAGAAGLAGAFLVGQGAFGGEKGEGGLAAALMMTLLLRKSSKLLADPRALKDIQTALRRNVKIDLRRAAGIRVLRKAVEDDPEFRNEITQEIRQLR